MHKTFYVTNAIPYVNAKPHIGFALELCISDVIARAHREAGDEVWYLTGADENSIKNVQAAEKAGVGTRQFIDEHTQIFRQLNAALNISCDDFIRTTEERHHKGAAALWDACVKNGDIYKKSYEGLYCNGCEAFYLEKDLVGGLCPEHRTKPELVKEENWFFKLSKYQNFLEEQFANGKVKIHPQKRANETLHFIKHGLEDFSISRSNERAKNWGVEVPGDPPAGGQKMYVWFDALANYITALGYGSKNAALFKKFWSASDAKILHIIGKGITKFHAIYWPAMLESAGIFPKNGLDILVHGYITVNGEKISKSLGNTVDPFALVEKYGADAVRYFLLREIPTTEDGDFSEEKFVQRYNADLANGLGNLMQRVTALAEKLPLTNLAEADLDFLELKDDYAVSLKHYQLHRALEVLWRRITHANQYVDEQKPWEKQGGELEKILANLSLHILRIAKSLWPFLPRTTREIFECFGVSSDAKVIDKNLALHVKKGKPLFKRCQETP